MKYTTPEILDLGDTTKVIRGPKLATDRKDPDKVEISSSYDPEE